MSETYTTGADSGYQPTSPKLIGQTFTPVVEHQLEYIDLNISIWEVGGDLVISVHDLETDPDMTGRGISRATQTNFEPGAFFTRQRIRTPMPKVTLLKDHLYGFCVTNHPEPWWNKIFVRYDLADATYPRGQRFTKENRADPPTYYPDSDLIFTEFGRPVAPPIPPDPPPNPPPTPPDPPIDKWLGFSIHQELTMYGYIITLYTNVPCHLWMRWSVLPPWIHKIPVTRRGLTTMSDFYYCFDVYHDNEQEEPGDTLVHTFIKEPWASCETRYFYFHGQIDNVNIPSTSPIFKKHRLWEEPPAPVYDFECWEEFDTGEYTRNNKAWAYTFIPQADLTLSLIKMQGHKHTGVGDHDCIITVSLAPVTDDTMGGPISTATLDTAVLPHYPYRWGDFTLEFTAVDLTAGIEYAVWFPPGEWGGTCYLYRIRTTKKHTPCCDKRGFSKSGEAQPWIRKTSGTYYYFHGKVYKLG